MQYVSQEYKESMKQTLRDRGYIRVVFGGANSTAQNNATISEGESYSDPSRVFNNGNDDFVYATLEKNFTKVDGSMYFDSANPSYWHEHLEKDFVSDLENLQAVISFDTVVSFSKITFNFGNNYPVSFTLTDNENNTYSYTNTTGRIFEIDQTFEDITELTLTVTEMLNEHNRLRIYSIRFDNNFEYQNDMIIDSNFDSSFSPIDENLPQMNFSVKLVNENHYFDTDNPKSILHNFDTSTIVNIYYGYQLSDHIEWLQAAKLYVENWDSDKESATIYARDILQTNDKEYTGGNFASITLYNLAVAIFTEMGITDYSIDDSLKNITTINSFTKISCKEALQVIANASCKKLFIQRDGSVRIGESIYSYEFSSDDDIYYSDVEKIGTNDTKYNYGTLEKNFTKIDGSMYFDSGNPSYSHNYLNNGFVSKQISNSYRLFNSNKSDIGLTEVVLRNNVLNLPYDLNEATNDEGNPVITVTLSGSLFVGSLKILFGDTYATRFIVRFLNTDNEVLNQIGVINNQKDFEIEFTNEYAEKIEIEFVETVESHNRVRVNYIELSQGSSFSFDDIDIMTYPKFTKFETLQKIVVPYYTYSNGNATEHIVEEVINTKGSVVKWENPLITTQTMAENLLAWLKEYYLLDGTYEFDTRGNPEIDVNDNVTQKKYDGTDMKVLVLETSLGFDGAFSGSIKTLKKGDAE